MKLMWLTDLHLDEATEKRRFEFYSRLRNENCDAVVITGDISDASGLPGHLRAGTNVWIATGLFCSWKSLMLSNQ